MGVRVDDEITVPGCRRVALLFVVTVVGLAVALLVLYLVYLDRPVPPR